ncbi:MAG: right-handed parallel beta-helix repeat-containing protein [Verrucomicrobiales bacterium]|nr:right-handed parallel beta-helix repeat-containing protein [Verrucomicrobiales bacterium]
MHTLPTAALLAILITPANTHATEHTVTSNQQLNAAARAAKPGDTIHCNSSSSFSTVHLSNLNGTRDKPITITGTSPENPARFKGGKTALHLSRSNHVTLRHLDISGCSINGINIDDGGDKTKPSRGIVIEHCQISDIGPRGNHDAIKLSGLDDFTVRHCTITGWGGSGIDMVGCHDGVVENCEFTGKPDFSQSNAVQMKGGSARITVKSCLFRDAGQRAINIGGSTGLDYFRPRVGDFEASDIEIANNRFIGSMAPIAWVGNNGGHVHHNTIYKPTKWVARILQENQAKGFRPAHGGIFEHNLIVFDRQVSTFINIGGGTAPDTFTFRHNAWFDTTGRNRKPKLPTPETNAAHNIDPKLTNTLKITSPNPSLRDKGAH